ncbi:MAG: sel1 repeat family protein, partial [Magnetococcales bacterium]|nr:sel1 repeat family protein [Magnetococcales bacterium]
GTGWSRCFLHGLAIVLCLGGSPHALAAETPESLFAATQRAATAGDAEAMMLLGHMYARGTGVAMDAGQAIKWYSLAAGRGHAEASAARDRLLAATGRVTPPSGHHRLRGAPSRPAVQGRAATAASLRGRALFPGWPAPAARAGGGRSCRRSTLRGPPAGGERSRPPRGGQAAPTGAETGSPQNERH